MLKSLIALRLQALIASLNRQRKPGQPQTARRALVMGLLFVYVGGVYLWLFYQMFASLAEALFAQGQDALYYGIAAALALILGFAGSVFATESLLYEANDNELLLSMPIRPRLIFVSRMISLYLTNLVFTALVMLPALAAAYTAGSLKTTAVCYGLVGLFILPIGSLAISCVLGALLALISSHVRNKAALSLGITLVLLGAYFVLIFNSENVLNWILTHTEQVASFINTAGWRAHQLALSMAGGSAGPFMLFLISALAPMAVVVFILDRSFIGIVTRHKGTKKIQYRKGEMRVSSPRTALLVKELRHFGSSATWMLNGGLGLIFALVGPVMLLRRAEFIQNFAGAVPVIGEHLNLCVSMYICVALSMVTISAASVSIEGKNWWQTAVMPVHAGDALLAKGMMHVAVGLPFVLVGAVLTLCAGGAGLADGILVFVMPVSYLCATALLGVCFNLRFPNMTWLSEAQAVKTGFSVALYMAAALGLVVVPLLIWGLLLGNVINLTGLALCMTVLYVILSALLAHYLSGRGAKVYSRLGD